MAEAERCDPAEVVCNLPELLAHDLEMSEGAFIRKNMTAGTPVQHLAPEDEYHQLYPGLRRSRILSDAKDASINRLSLSAIEGRLHSPDIEAASDDAEEDGFTSDSSDDSFMAMEPPTVRMRNQSVATAATSVNLNDGSSTSHCSSPKQFQRCSLTAFEGGNLDTPELERSWFELGTPMESGNNTDDDMAPESIPAQTMSNMETLPPEPSLNPDADEDTPDEGVGRDGSLRGSVVGAEHVDYALSPPLPATTQLHPPHSRRTGAQSYLENKRAARNRGTQSIASLPSHLHINPLALNPTRLTRSETVHDQPTTSPSRLPPKAASTITAEEQQRPSTASGIPPSSEKPRVIKLPPRQVIAPGRSSVLALNLGPSFSFDPASLERRHSSKPDSILAKRIRKALNRMSGRTFIDATTSRVPAPDTDEGDGSKVDNTSDDSNKQCKQDSSVPEAGLTTEARDDHESRRKAQDQAFKEVKQIIHPSGRPLSPPNVSQEIFNQDVTAALAGWTGPGTELETPTLFTQLPPPPGLGPEQSVRPGLPLPPHVLENLRVSVKGFPDTMLLTSSLSIETIRTYAKKLRRPENSLDLSPLSPVGTVGSTSSRWKRSMGRTASRTTLNPLPPVDPNDLNLTRTSSTTRSSPSWSCIKRVFPSGSDYRCEALYAHLLAYNYLATICGHDVVPLTLPVPSPVRRGTAPVHVRCASLSAEMLARTEPDFFPVVPKKAAHLLGIGAGSDAPRNMVRTASLKSVGGVRSLLKRGRRGRDEVDIETLAGKPGGKPGNEVALREIMTGLVKCIAALVRLLKNAASVESGAGDEIGEEEEGDDVAQLDMHMFRALCELVRAEEEMAE